MVLKWVASLDLNTNAQKSPKHIHIMHVLQITLLFKLQFIYLNSKLTKHQQGLWIIVHLS